MPCRALNSDVSYWPTLYSDLAGVFPSNDADALPQFHGGKVLGAYKKHDKTRQVNHDHNIQKSLCRLFRLSPA